MALNLHGAGDSREYLLQGFIEYCIGFYTVEDNQKLVAPYAQKGIFRLGKRFDPLYYLSEYGISYMVSKFVVDRFKFVKVNIAYGTLLILFSRKIDGMVYLLSQQVAVGKAGQEIIVGHRL